MLKEQVDGRTGGQAEGYLLGVSFCVGQLGGHVKHDLLVAEVAVHRLGPRLPVGHVQASSEPAPGPPQATAQSPAPARPRWDQDGGSVPAQRHGSDSHLPIPTQGSPLKVLQFDLLAQKLEELHEGRALLVGAEEFFLGGLAGGQAHRGQRSSSWGAIPHSHPGRLEGGPLAGPGFLSSSPQVRALRGKALRPQVHGQMGEGDRTPARASDK